MTELLSSPVNKDGQYTRREFIKAAFQTSAVFLAADVAYNLTAGNKFSPITQLERMFSPNGIRLFPEKLKLEKYRYFEDLKDPKLGKAFIDNVNFFIPGRTFLFCHRSGNHKKDIELAFRMGANLFDIDLNHAYGTNYGAHGSMIPNTAIAIDGIEGELEILPPTFEGLIKHVASLSTKDNPLGVSIDLKQRTFTEKGFENLIKVLFKYNVPAVIGSTSSAKQLATIRKIRDEYEIS